MLIENLHNVVVNTGATRQTQQNELFNVAVFPLSLWPRVTNEFHRPWLQNGGNAYPATTTLLAVLSSASPLSPSAAAHLSRR